MADYNIHDLTITSPITDKIKLPASIDGVFGSISTADLPTFIQSKLASKLLDAANFEAGTGITITATEDGKIKFTHEINHTLYEMVDSLPTEDIKTDVIYVVPADETDTNNTAVEYIYVNGAWEKFGEFKADLDLSSYAKTTEVNTKISTELANYTKTTDLNTKLADYAKTTEVTSAIADAVADFLVEADLADYAKTTEVDNKLKDYVKKTVTDAIEAKLQAYDERFGYSKVGDNVVWTKELLFVNNSTN